MSPGGALELITPRLSSLTEESCDVVLLRGGRAARALLGGRDSSGEWPRGDRGAAQRRPGAQDADRRHCPKGRADREGTRHPLPGRALPKGQGEGPEHAQPGAWPRGHGRRRQQRRPRSGGHLHRHRDARGDWPQPRPGAAQLAKARSAPGPLDLSALATRDAPGQAPAPILHAVQHRAAHPGRHRRAQASLGWPEHVDLQRPHALRGGPHDELARSRSARRRNRPASSFGQPCPQRRPSDEPGALRCPGSWPL